MHRDTTPSGASSPGDLPAAGEAYLADYYEHVPEEDLEGHSSAALERLARTHAALASVRPPRTPMVRIATEGVVPVVFVVADDAPHLVRSVTAELAKEGAPARLLVHPTFLVLRHPESHELLELRRGPAHEGLDPARPPAREGGGWEAETWIAAELGRQLDQPGIRALVAALEGVVEDVRLVAEDAATISGRFAAAVERVARIPGPVTPPAAQLRELLRWLERGNFVLMGSCDYGRTTAEGREVLRRRPGTGLGLLRRRRSPSGSLVPTLRVGQALTVLASELRSSVERSGTLEEFRVGLYDGAGAMTGERRFVGAFTPGAARQSLPRIPVLRDKLAAAQELLGGARASRGGPELLAALESVPLVELFQSDATELARLAQELLRVHERRQTRLFLFRAPDLRFVTALVFLPRQRGTPAIRLRIEEQLLQAFGASSLESEILMGEGPMARVVLRVHMPPGAIGRDVDAAGLERSVVRATMTWAEQLSEALRVRWPSRASRLSTLWAGAFPASYRAEVEVDDAVEDIARFEDFDLDGSGGRPLSHPMLLVSTAPRSAGAPAPESPVREARIRLYLTEARSLTQILPVLHNFGLEVVDERPYSFLRGGNLALFLYDLGVIYPAGVEPSEAGGKLAEAFGAAVTGRAESDRFDALVLREGVGWQEVAILRAYAKYLVQLGAPNSYGFTAEALVAHGAVTRGLLGLFRVRFDPALRPSTRLRDEAAARAEVVRAIDAVASLDADRLLRTFLNLIEATTRTNAYRNRDYLSFKLQPTHLRGAPAPRPEFEVWVYSPRVEGIHVRFGPLARGGIRWSERQEDFRTEVLGLAKAQIVKNAVIVPTGAKGGFYPKRLPDPDGDRSAWLAEGAEAYKEFLRGLLDVTDNLAAPAETDAPELRAPRGGSGRVVPAHGVVRHDDDDFYLVVAADKGTAAFSDLANGVAAEYGYWLGDAFASGGSVGYDHKKLGITARGAWESVRAHFAELGIDPRRDDFTVAGIGDMSGDVFGNGMLLSAHIRLVAAFDHRHIFLDPDPDPAAALAERRRLFDLPRSSWADFRTAVLSPGGGVHARAAKSIPITPQVRAALGLPPTTTAMTPPELIRAILCGPVDLLYFGGIGTYVKASTETAADVGDKANDPIRIDPSELRARVVVEGGNLGLTQRGRVEAALRGVLVTTDATDNSAGVDCSDHEVNLKVFLDRMIAAGKLPATERADLLHAVEDDVAHHVLRNNRDQNALLRNDRSLALDWSPGFERTMDWLEKATGLDRSLEALPTTDELHGRLQTGTGLTAPELSVLAAYAKLHLATALNESDVTDDPWFDRVLFTYFPPQIGERFGEELGQHPLRRQIISTVLANDVVNLGGTTFTLRAVEETAGTAAGLAKAFVAVREAFGLAAIADRIAALPPEVSSEHASELVLYARGTLDRATRWYMTHSHRDQSVARGLGRILPAVELRRTRSIVYQRGDGVDLGQDLLTRWISAGVPPDLANGAVDVVMGFSLLDVSLIAEQVDEPLERIAALYSAAFERIGALRLLLRITDLPRQSRWQALARAALREDLYGAVSDLTLSVLRTTRGPASDQADALGRIAEWERGHHEQLARIREMLDEATRPGQGDIESISVALNLLRAVVHS